MTQGAFFKNNLNISIIHFSNMDWDTFTEETKKLGEKIDYTPDCIIGIARGGVIPAVLLSKQLKIKDMYVLKVRVEGNERKVMAEVFTDISNKKVLVVEDMLESGKTMMVVKQYLESKGANVKTACLYVMPHTEIKPEFYLKEIQKVEHFPWE
jgi:uncharacterized protein